MLNPLIKINALRKLVEAENISLNGLLEIDRIAKKYGIKVTDEMLAIDILNEIENKIEGSKSL